MEDQRKGDWIETYTGESFYPLDPRMEEINIRDIAHSLSLLCRFNGQCSEFYSIAQHSVEVSLYIENKLYGPNHTKYAPFSLRGLLHDGGEAYCSDIPRPIKPFLTGYKDIENKIEWMIYRKYKCADSDIKVESFNCDELVKEADLVLLATEARDLHMNKNGDWHLPYPPMEKAIIPMTPKESERYFLDRFYELAR